MAAYYNDNDPKVAAWLRQLIKKGLIAAGEVDERSISEVKAHDLRGFTQCHFFAGIGGWGLALRLAGWPDDRPVWTGSCPCQPFSNAGKRQGVNDERHLWPELRRLIAECAPTTIFGEQVASKDGRAWLDAVQTDLAALGFAVGAADMCAAGVGSPQIRQRLWFGAERVADWNKQRPQGWALQPQNQDRKLAGEGSLVGGGGETRGFWGEADWLRCKGGLWRPVEPGASPLADGIPSRVGRIRGYGNAIVPQVAAVFIESFAEAASKDNV